MLPTLLFFLPAIFAKEFDCYHCSALKMEDPLLEIGFKKALSETFKELELSLPPDNSACFSEPSTRTKCQTQCIHLSAKIDFTRYSGPNPQIDPSTSYKIKDIGRTEFVMRGCLETVVSLKKWLDVDLTIEKEDQGCINAKAYAVGAAAGAQLCVCNRDRCLPGDGVPMLPAAPTSGTLMAPDSFTYIECMSYMGSKQFAEPFQFIYDTILYPENGTKLAPANYDVFRTCFDPKSHANSSMADELTVSGCKTAAVELGMALDTKHYRGPEFLSTATENNFQVKGMNGKAIVRTCLDQFDVFEFPALPQGKACLFSDASVWGLRANARVCLCNKNKCLFDPYDPILPDTANSIFLSLFCLVSGLISSRLAAKMI